VFSSPRLALLVARAAPLALALFGGAACRGERAAPAAGAAEAPAAVVAPSTGAAPRDDDGVPVPLGRRPRRIVSTGPVTTEVLFAIGAGDRLVGRSRWDGYPAAARRVPEVGDALGLNLERILATRPDLVVIYSAAANREAAARLRALDIPVVALRIDRVDELARGARLLGRVVGESAAAVAVVDSVQRTLARVRAATQAAVAAGRPRPRVVMPLLGEPLFVIGGGSFLSELVDVAGGTNVFADDVRPSPQVSREEVLRRGADVVLVSPGGARRLAADPGWRGLAAVRDGRVLTIDTALVQRPSVQLGQAAVMLARLLHPSIALDGAPSGGAR
jgi:ABC-type Fe3+-hydroxamate transport system substrate-binding protein